MNNDSVNARNEESTLGEPMVPEPEESGTVSEDEVDAAPGAVSIATSETTASDISDELYLTLSPEEEAEDMTAEVSDAVPHGTKSESGTKIIKKADLVSMWKYMLSSSYANRRLSLYTFLNSLLRRGMLSEIVGFKVLNRVINRQACEFTGVTFWKIDREDFYADVKVTLTLESPSGTQTWNGILACWCSFEEDDKFSMSVEELAESIDRKEDGFVMLSPFLIPYYTNEQMDKFVDQVWISNGMPEAIHNPSLRNATELARRLGLTIQYLDVYEHRNMDSIIFFADSELTVGEDRIEKQEDGSKKHIKTGFPTKVKIPANTIVVNTNRIRRDYSAFNIFHECIHYLLHYMFFRLQNMASNDIRLFRIKEEKVEEGKKQSDPIYFMEGQANRGALALMMPADDTRARIQNECGKVKKYKNLGEKMEIVGKALSRELGYPYFRIKPRMIQLGYIEARGALNYDDNHKLIQPFAFSRDAWRENEVTFVVKESMSNALYRTSDDFRAVMDSGKFVFADGHIVRNNPRCVTKDGDKLILTEEAAGRVDDCCLRFTRSYVQRDVGDYYLGRMFLDQHLIERTGFYLKDTINEKNLDELDAKIEYRAAFPRLFVDAFDQVMEQNNETRETTAARLFISSDTLHDWLHDPDKYGKLDFIVRITLMWEIPDFISDLLMDRAGIKPNEYDRRQSALEHVRTVLWDQGIEEGNKYLASKEVKLLEPYGPPQPEGRRRRRKRKAS